MADLARHVIGYHFEGLRVVGGVFDVSRELEAEEGKPSGDLNERVKSLEGGADLVGICRAARTSTYALAEAVKDVGTA